MNNSIRKNLTGNNMEFPEYISSADWNERVYSDLVLLNIKNHLNNESWECKEW